MTITRLLIILLAQYGACGNWNSYKDEKCFGVLVDSGLQSFDGARAACRKLNGTLLQITSSEEQSFITNLVFNTYKVVDDVWIGAHRVDKGFKWDLDNTGVGFSNWADKSPSNATGEDCVQMLPKLTLQGKWDDENCNKKNFVVCQRYQIWTPAVIQQTLLKERKQLEELLNQLKSQQDLINGQTNQINTLKTSVANTIPIGFTYVQLAKEKAPAEIWPALKWQDVSAQYAGFFFRVEGGASGKFGVVQEDDCPRLSKVSLSDAKGYVDAGAHIAKGGVGKIKAGTTGGPWYFQFEVSNTEVRPRNMAMRVWRRSA